MKIATLTAIASTLVLGAPAIVAEEPATMKTEMKCEMCEMMKKKAAAKAEIEQASTELAAQTAELEKLVAEMNGSLGSKKVEAMAAVVTRLVEQYKALSATTPTAPKPASEAHHH